MGRYTMKDVSSYTIDADEWETVDMTDGGRQVQEWQYTDYDAEFRVTLKLHKGHGAVKLLGESFTYTGDSVYYYDVMAGYPRPCCTVQYLTDYSPVALDEYGDEVDSLADIFRQDEAGRVHIVGMVELPAQFIEDMESYCENDSELDSLAYEFSEFADENGLDCDDWDALESNVNTWLARVKGCQQYGFADVPVWVAYGVVHFYDERYRVRPYFGAPKAA